MLDRSPVSARSSELPTSASPSSLSSERRALRRVQVLSDLPARLASACHEPELREAVVRALGELFAPARVSDFLFEEDGSLVSTAEASATDELLRAVGGVAALSGDARTWAPNLLPRARTGRGAVLSAPVLEGGALVGLLIVEPDPLSPDPSLQELGTLCAVAGQAALAVSRLRSDGGRASREMVRQQRDLELAGKIQRRFLSAMPDELRGVKVACDYVPAFDVGGDFYAVVPVGREAVNVVIGDVCGHGVAAALMMARVSYDFHRLTRGVSSPAAMFREINAAMAEHCPDDAFVTALCLRIDLARGVVTVANAGHLLPFVRRSSGKVELPEAPLGLPLGMDPCEVYEEACFPMEPGDVVLVTTDGLVDALGGRMTPTGVDSLARLLASAPRDVVEVNRALLRAAGAELRSRADDVAIVTIEMLEQAPPSSALRRFTVAA